MKLKIVEKCTECGEEGGCLEECPDCHGCDECCNCDDEDEDETEEGG